MVKRYQKIAQCSRETIFPRGGPVKKIYIIDDDRNIVESMSIVLRANGFEVEAQYDEKRVVENLLSKKPDLVILDVMFPENESAGFDVAREIRNNPKTEALPVLMLSAINEKGVYAGTFSNKDRDDSFLPVDEFIEKPVKPAQLLQKVNAALQKAGRPRT
jgi:DNA-binding response OmpR family regulator